MTHLDGHMTFGDYFMMYLSRWKRASVLLIFIWIVITYLVISPLRCAEKSGRIDEIAEFQERLKLVTTKLDALNKQHNNLIEQIRRNSGSSGNLKINIDPAVLLAGQGPTDEYETLRRRIYTNTKELWYYLKSELSKLLQEEDKTKIADVLSQTAERKRSLLADQQKLRELDGYDDWRRNEAGNVSDLIQRRLKHLQNPPNCVEARKVVCNLNKGCGFGCQLHHIIYCLIFAYATERTLILNSKGWRYNAKGWDHVFYPISDTCNSVYEDKITSWPAQYNAKVISLPFIDSMAHKPTFLPLAIPKDLAHRIIRFNGDPASWWVGQMLKYVLKPRPELQKAINETIASMNFKTPIVGVHVRRTDKVGTEAAFHHIHEYMSVVDDYYDTLDLTRTAGVHPRRVYLASDDPNVLEDARKKYPQYEFLGDQTIAKSAATHKRYTPLALRGLLVDLHMLSMCDFLVCTFSSQVGRSAYEMMQTNRVDASDSFYSLDDIYYFGGQNAHDRVAVMDHTATGASDFSFKVGDLIGIAGNHWNGFGRGTNRKTNEAGFIPMFKTADHLVLYPFPEYKEVPLYTDTRQ